ncbi:MAG: hypothetical protein PVH77_04615 [Phycisphaerales bacterium]|jgi:hypothetical protein
MTKRELAAFILKLLGVYAIIQSLTLRQYISLMLASLGRGNDNVFRLAWVFLCTSVPFALMLVIAIILLARNRRLVSTLVKEDGPTGLGTSLSSQEIQAIGFSIVAVLVFLLAVPKLVQFFVALWYIQSAGFEGVRPGLVRNAWQSGLSVAVQLTLAVLLFFRGRGLANIWRRIQVAKYEKIEESE